MLETLTTVLRKEICNKWWKITEQYHQLVVMDRETGKSKGFAFIEMEDDAAAAKAIAELNGAEYMGRTMVVKEARPRA